MAGKWLDQLQAMMQTQPQASAAPERLGFAERLIAAGQRPSENVSVRTVPDGPVEPLPPGTLPWTPLSDEIRDWRKEQEIGYPFPSEPGFETQTGPMPDVSQGLYHPAGTVDMGPYPALPSTLATFAARPPRDPRRR